MSFPYTSPQKGKTECMFRTINSVVRSLFQDNVLLNILPTKAINLSTPHIALFGSPPSYTHLCVFSCQSYPNLSATGPHKLAPPCVFSSVTPLTIRVIVVLISIPTGSIFLGMLSSMRRHFPFQQTPPTSKNF